MARTVRQQLVFDLDSKKAELRASKQQLAKVQGERDASVSKVLGLEDLVLTTVSALEDVDNSFKGSAVPTDQGLDLVGKVNWALSDRTTRESKLTAVESTLSKVMRVLMAYDIMDRGKIKPHDHLRLFCDSMVVDRMALEATIEEAKRDITAYKEGVVSLRGLLPTEDQEGVGEAFISLEAIFSTTGFVVESFSPKRREARLASDLKNCVELLGGLLGDDDLDSEEALIVANSVTTLSDLGH